MSGASPIRNSLPASSFHRGDGSASISRPWRSEVRATSISPMIFSSVSASDSKPPVSG
jgi:hypothetical protein